MRPEYIQKTINFLDERIGDIYIDLIMTESARDELLRNFPDESDNNIYRDEQEKKTIFLPNEDKKETVQKSPKGNQTPTVTGGRGNQKDSSKKKTTTAAGRRNKIESFLGKSKYKGVSRMGKKWRAQFYENKKLEHLGTFDIEELAAAAYAERAGNPSEAQRLRQLAADMTEQAENNPDKPNKVKSKKAK